MVTHPFLLFLFLFNSYFLLCPSLFFFILLFYLPFFLPCSSFPPSLISRFLSSFIFPFLPSTSPNREKRTSGLEVHTRLLHGPQSLWDDSTRRSFWQTREWWQLYSWLSIFYYYYYFFLFLRLSFFPCSTQSLHGLESWVYERFRHGYASENHVTGIRTSHAITAGFLAFSVYALEPLPLLNMMNAYTRKVSLKEFSTRESS